MASKRDYYEILGVSKDADAGEIKKAYKKLALANHPDRNPGDEAAIARFKEAAEAYEVLGDAEKRARYDRYGHAGVEGAGFSDLGDILQGFGGLGDLLDGLFGGGGGRQRTRSGVRQGSRIEAEVVLSLKEAATGVDRTLKVDRLVHCATCFGTGAKSGTSPEECDYCGGHGEVVQSQGFFRVQTTCPACQGAGSVIRDKCPDCRGRGQKAEQVEVVVPIPAGVDNGMQVRVPGEGHEGLGGGPSGDLYVHTVVESHPLFQREGLHLTCRIPITYTQAALGTELEVPTLDGKHNLSVPKGTQPGTVFPLRGQGMPKPHGGSRGDLYVEVQVDIPKKLSERQEEILRELAEIENADVSPHRKSFRDKVRQWFKGDEDD